MITKEEYKQLQKIFQEFCLADNRLDQIKIWHKYRKELFDCRLLMASSGDDPFKLKIIFDHPSLKPLFAGEDFVFLNNYSVEYHNLGKFQPISLDPCIVIDSNLVARVNGFVNLNKRDKETKEIKETNDTLKFIMTKPFYYGFYAVEEYENYVSNKNHFQIKQKLKAICLFDHINKEKYLNSNESVIEFLIGDEEANKWVESKFAEMFSSNSLPYLINLKNTIYLLLLKVCEIEFRSNKKHIEVEAKICEFYEFMHLVLKRLMGKEAYLINMYFEKNKKLKNNGETFFDPIQISNKKLFQHLNGMANDLVLLRTIERMPDISNQANILLPYFVSRDKRLNHVCDLLPKISKFLFYSTEKGANFMAEWENQTNIINKMKSKLYWEKISWFYNEDAENERLKAQHENPQIYELGFDQIIKELEITVKSFLEK